MLGFLIACVREAPVRYLETEAQQHATRSSLETLTAACRCAPRARHWFTDPGPGR